MVELLAEDLQGKLGASDDIKQLIAAADTNGKQLLHPVLLPPKFAVTEPKNQSLHR